jgi:hypothetical protein
MALDHLAAVNRIPATHNKKTRGLKGMELRWSEARVASNCGHSAIETINLFPPPALREGCHCGLATLGIAVCGHAVLVVPDN